MLPLFSLIFLFLRLPSLFEPYWYGDEGIYLTVGQAINKGWLLYQQIHDNKPPTLYLQAALSHTVFGFRLLLLLWMIPTIYFFYRLSKNFLSLSLSKLATLIFLILTSVPLIEGNIANAEIFMLLPTILALFLYLSSSKTIISLFSGLLLGFAFTIKVPVFIELAFICYWIVLTDFKIKKIILFIAGFITPIFLYSLYFVANRAFGEFVFSSLLQNFSYLSSWSTGSHSGSATSGGLLIRGLILGLFWLFIFFLHLKKTIPPKLTFLVLWFTASLFGALLSTRPYPHYLIQILPSFCLLSFYFFNKQINQSSRYLISALFILFIGVFIKYRFYTYPVFSYYKNFYSYALNLKNTQSYRSYFGNQVNLTYSITSYIKQNTNANDRIFVWGDNPFIYILSQRLPVGKYTVAYHIADFNQYQYVSDQLRILFPKFIIYFPQPSRPYPDLDYFVGRFYLPVKTFEDVVIYQRRD